MSWLIIWQRRWSSPARLWDWSVTLWANVLVYFSPKNKTSENWRSLGWLYRYKTLRIFKITYFCSTEEKYYTGLEHEHMLCWSSGNLIIWLAKQWTGWNLTEWKWRKEQDAELDETQQDANKKLNFPWLSEDLRVNISVRVSTSRLSFEMLTILYCVGICNLNRTALNVWERDQPHDKEMVHFTKLTACWISEKHYFYILFITSLHAILSE